MIFKILIVLLIASPCAFAKDPIQSVINAFAQTQAGKNVKKEVENIGKDITKILPDEISVLAVIGIQQRIDFNLDQNNRFEINYIEQKVTYSYQLNF
jgi:hypothetical protein